MNFSFVTGTFGLFVMVVWLGILIFTLLHAIGNRNLDKNSKILWVGIMIVVPIMGSLVYMFWRMVKRIAN